MKRVIFPLLLSAVAVVPTRAQEKASPEARMREALRNTTLQVRTLQAERDELSVKKDQAEAQAKTLEDQIKILTKRAAEDKDIIDSGKAALQEEQARSHQTAAELEKWKSACHKAVELAKTKEAERAALSEKVIILERTVADQKSRNAEMFKIGCDLLRRYENFGLGKALSAREPFVGVTRVKLENLVQDYSDKLSNQRIKP